MEIFFKDQNLKDFLIDIAKSDVNITIFGCCDDCSRKMARWMAGYFLNDKGKSMFVINRGKPLGIADIYRNSSVEEVRIGYGYDICEAVKNGLENMADCFTLKVSDEDRTAMSLNDLALQGARIIDIRENLNSCKIDGSIPSMEELNIPGCMKIGIYTSCSDDVQEIVSYQDGDCKVLYLNGKFCKD